MAEPAENKPLPSSKPAATRLEHVNLVVTNIPPTLNFLKTAFPNWRVRGEGGGDWYGKPRRWVHFGDDDFYVTLNDHGEGAYRDLAGYTTGLAHVGFAVDDIEAVKSRLNAAGYEVNHNGEDHPHRRNIYYVDPHGLEFEFVEYFSNISTEKNSYA